MTWTRYLQTPVTIKHRSDSTPDPYGNATVTSTSSQSLGLWHPESQTEYLMESETYITHGRLVLDAGTVITARDEVTIDGRDYEVVSVSRVINPRTKIEHHVLAQLAGMTG